MTSAGTPNGGRPNSGELPTEAPAPGGAGAGPTVGAAGGDAVERRSWASPRPPYRPGSATDPLADVVADTGADAGTDAGSARAAGATGAAGGSAGPDLGLAAAAGPDPGAADAPGAGPAGPSGAADSGAADASGAAGSGAADASGAASPSEASGAADPSSAPAAPAAGTSDAAGASDRPSDPTGTSDPATPAEITDPDLAAELAEAAADLEAAEAAAEMEVDLEVAAVSRQRDEYLDSLRRVQADFENYRKRTERQRVEHVDRAVGELVNKLLPVCDTVDLAIAHGGGEEVKQIWTALFETLERAGLERIDPDGGSFDPTVHDAVAVEPGSGSGIPEVVEVMRAGYRWKGRVLRPAMVKVKG